MCNLYTLAPWEVRHLMQHYRLIGRDFEEVMRGRNETLDVYPNRPAPVVVEEETASASCGKTCFGAFRRSSQAPVTGQISGTSSSSNGETGWTAGIAASFWRRPSPSPTRTRRRVPWCGAGSSAPQAALLLCRDLAAMDRSPTQQSRIHILGIDRFQNGQVLLPARTPCRTLGLC
jgi:hypothetical protein